MTDFVINRSQLMTGTALKVVQAEGFDPALYDSLTGLSCIVGLYLQSVGVKQSALDGRGSPESLLCQLPAAASWVLSAPNQESKTSMALTAANDHPTLHQIRREQKIAKLFATERINAVWVGKYAEATRAARRALQN